MKISFVRQSRPTRQSTALLLASTLLIAGTPSAVFAQREREPGQSRPPGDRLGAEGSRPPRGNGDRRGEHPFGPPPPLWTRMSQEEQGQMQSFIQEHFPSMYLELERLKDRNPRRFEHRMNRLAPEIRSVMETMETQPERATLMIQSRRLDMQMRQLADRYHSTEEEQTRLRLRGRFRELCAQAFDCRHRRREMEIRELEARVTELIQRHEEAARMRDQLIDQTVRDRLDQRGPVAPEPPPQP